ncbi:iron-containing alcohol dehydrogenase family protein [Celerinatantimonas diazotrophica]|uniref:Glycerol dehydrogenase n=1 Tax=Celerinatantimonas diazotrophica TaxID=412034 RepID=A0A4R1J823_9GAMM|nr:iron-containing alcohol dehydrogenase family protein [Celerinatantimonas diazotrophica]TCK46713.1 glycerol dehydrogenase [Celerinatantimonas diazotrophica]CAG9295415.1 Glycerol dehydrogenase [Celerinatantimonas diazotrophica]
MSVEFHFPAHYHRGPDVAQQLAKYCQQLGPKAMVLGGHTALKVLKEHVGEIANASYHWFGGVCSINNINKLKAIAETEQAQVIVAVGGGKALDTGKAVAVEMGLPIITIPTIAATCAAVTPLSIRYLDNGHFLDLYHLPSAPQVILVDTAILARSPQRWLAAGLGDTLAKLYEYRSLRHDNSIVIGDKKLTAFTSQLCFDLIQTYGADACHALNQGQSNEALEQVVDAIMLYAGMTSLMASGAHATIAHGLFEGLTVNDDVREFGHGLLVGYGNLVLLALEQRSDDELIEAIQLAKDCQIPTTLAEIKPDWSEAELDEVYQATLATPDAQLLPFKVTIESLAQACQRVDALSSRV